MESLTQTVKEFSTTCRESVAQLLSDAYENPTAVAATGAIGTAAAFAVALKTRKVQVPVLLHGTTEAVKDIGVMELRAADPLAKLYSRVSPSIAKVECIQVAGGKEAFSSGTAFSVSKDGKLLTANHVVRDKLDFAIVDAKGAVHEARVIASDIDNDVALLQLADPRAFAKFPPLPIAKNFQGKLKPEDVTAVGHPSSMNDVFVSPGLANAPTPWSLIETNRLIGAMRVESGNSGGPLVNRNGEVVGVAIRQVKAATSDAGTSKQYVYLQSTMIDRAEELLRKAGVSAPESARHAQHTSSWRIENPMAARNELESLFQHPLAGKPTKTGWHSSMMNVTLNDTHQVLLRTSLNTHTRTVSVRPVAMNLEPLDEMMTWSDIPIKSAELVIKLDRKFRPLSMVSHNDPYDILRFAFKGSNRESYLASLKTLKPEAITV